MYQRGISATSPTEPEFYADYILTPDVIQVWVVERPVDVTEQP